jgi:hypothetical protein
MTAGHDSAAQLEGLIFAADIDGVIASIEGMAPAQRAAQRQNLLHLHKLIEDSRWKDDRGETTMGLAVTDEHWRAVGIALLLCGTAKDAARARLDDDDLIALGLKYRPSALEGLAEAELQISPYRIVTVSKLIAAGLCPRPKGDDYALGLIALPRAASGRTSIATLMAADPGLAASLPRVFDIEGTADCSLASIDKYNHTPEHAWPHILIEQSRRGVISRAELLDKTLGALERDWPQHRSGWFSRFHESLAPDLAELAPHASRYLGLCHSRISPTVSLALGVVAKLAAKDLIEPGPLLAAMTRVMSSGVQAHVEAALNLVELAVRREPARSAAAASIITAGLAHPAAGIQGKILRRLAEWGLADDGKALLQPYMQGLAAVNHAAASALVGGEALAPLPAPRPQGHGAVAKRHGMSVLDPARRLHVIDDLPELVERAAFVFENSTDVDEFERVAEAVVRLAPQVQAARPQFAAVQKRALRVSKPLSAELARLLTFVLAGEQRDAKPVVDHGGNASLAHQYLIWRIDGLIDLAAQGLGVAPLSSPTHRHGFIDPQRLVERVARHQAAGAKASRFEQVSALLRLAPSADASIRQQAQALSENEFTRALRYALGDEVEPGPDRELFLAAARVRHPGADDALLARRFGEHGPDAASAARYEWTVVSRKSTYADSGQVFHDLVVSVMPPVPAGVAAELLAVCRHPPVGAATRRYYTWNFAGIDEGMVRYASTLVPSNPEAFFAEGARMLGNNLDWFEAQWQNRAYLDALLDCCVPFKPMATLALALGLAGKDPGQTAIAVDALVQAGIDGRLDVAALGSTLRDLLATPLVKAARLRKSLEAASRAEDGMPAVVFEVLCSAVTMEPPRVPKDLASLLELLLELALGQGLELSPSTRAALAALRLGGKGKALCAKLLAGTVAPS